jgi:crossover junction endodeoxyribonuclease RuvC
MVILGIDPGTNRIGYGLLENKGRDLSLIKYGCIELKSDGSSKDFVGLYDAIEDLIKKWNPDVMAIEKLFFFKNNKTVMQVSEARGIILLAGMKKGLLIKEFTPLQVKQAVSSYGRAQKREVQKMVRLILGLKEDPKPDDAADALAIAICCGNTNIYPQELR